MSTVKALAEMLGPVFALIYLASGVYMLFERDLLCIYASSEYSSMTVHICILTSMHSLIAYMKRTHLAYTVSHFSYAPPFQGPHFFDENAGSNIFYETLLIDILSL